MHTPVDDRRSDTGQQICLQEKTFLTSRHLIPDPALHHAENRTMSSSISPKLVCSYQQEADPPPFSLPPFS
jgi:hypothetical protein